MHRFYIAVERDETPSRPSQIAFKHQDDAEVALREKTLPQRWKIVELTENSTNTTDLTLYHLRQLVACLESAQNALADPYVYKSEIDEARDHIADIEASLKGGS